MGSYQTCSLQELILENKLILRKLDFCFKVWIGVIKIVLKF